MESKYDTKTLSVEKDILEKNNSQWEVIENSKLVGLQNSSFRNDWQSQRKIEVQRPEVGCFSQIEIISEKVPSYRNHKFLTLHQRFHDSKKPFKYKQYGKVLSCELSMDEYEKIHNGKKTSECSKYWETFGVDDPHTLQLNIHTGVKPCKCMECGNVFSFYEALSVHRDNQKCYKCKEYGGLLEELKKSLHFKEFRIVGNPMNALSVGNLLECMYNLLDIRKSILMRNLTNVWNVARTFDFIHS